MSSAEGEPTNDEDQGESTLDEPKRVTVEVVRADGREHALVKRFSLRVLAGPDAGAICTPESEHVAIGTHPSADLVLRDPTVSRFHCRITRGASGRAVVRDLGSRNGTLVQGVAVIEAPLPDTGATLTLGHTQLRFGPDPERVKIPLSERDRFGLLVGRSVPMRAVFAQLERTAATDSTVLLLGETGTGKEAAAESIHRASARAKGPFVVVDCGAIPQDLIESELFGHRRGAFTGAVESRRGAFERASGGTLFLDEIGELGSDMQTRLLRVLEQRAVKPVGAADYLDVDVRVIAATNRDLQAEVNARRFRSDLYYRLAVIDVRLPPLRDRPEDLPLLVERMLVELPGASGEAAELLRSPELLDDLSRHRWPGNVRELRNHLERCLALHERIPLVAQLPADGAGEPAVETGEPLKAARQKWTEAFERKYLVELLRRHEGNVAATARAAGVARAYFYRLLWRHGLR
jgi:transcriptional regulator with PAS, ATPase and Fis domain